MNARAIADREANLIAVAARFWRMGFGTDRIAEGITTYMRVIPESWVYNRIDLIRQAAKQQP